MAYVKGDFVHTKKDCSVFWLPDKDAVVDEVWGEDPKYALFFEHLGRVSWFYGKDLDLIEQGREDLKSKWEEAIEAKKKLTSGLDWIFSQSDAEALTGDSCQTLYSLMGGGDLWGERGECFTLLQNMMWVKLFAAPYVQDHDKAGFIEFAETFKKDRDKAIDMLNTKAGKIIVEKDKENL